MNSFVLITKISISCNKFKAALINIFLLITDQMAICNTKGVIHGDKTTLNDHMIEVPLTSKVCFSFFQPIIFVFTAGNFTVLIQ